MPRIMQASSALLMLKKPPLSSTCQPSKVLGLAEEKRASTEVSGFLKHSRSESGREGPCQGGLLGQYREPTWSDTQKTAGQV